MLKHVKNIMSRIPSPIKSGRVITVFALCAALVCATVYLGVSINTVNISDGERSYTVRTVSSDIDTAIKLANIKSTDYKVLKDNYENGVRNIKIAYTFPVFLTVGEITTKIQTAKATVADIIKLAGYAIDQYDMVEPKPDTVITESCYIDYSDINYTYATHKEVIPCSMQTVYSNKHMTGTSTVTKGTDGMREVTYSYKTVNGKLVETAVSKEVTLTAAVDGTTVIGTKKPAVTTSGSVNTVSTLTPPFTIELDANGNPVNYSKHITVQATGYTYTGNNCSTGVAPQPGYIAVNPKYIPYGTKMYIKSSDGSCIYGYAVAADTGGFIKTRPTNVDLFFTTRQACVNFGRRNVEIYFL